MMHPPKPADEPLKLGAKRESVVPKSVNWWAGALSSEGMRSMQTSGHRKLERGGRKKDAREGYGLGRLGMVRRAHLGLDRRHEGRQRSQR